MFFLVFIMNLDVNFMTNYSIIPLSLRMGQLYKWAGPGPSGPPITLHMRYMLLLNLLLDFVCNDAINHN